MRVALIVDDNKDIADLLAEILSFSVCDVNFLTAENTKQAVEILKNNKVEFLISDWQLCAESGVELVDVARSEYGVENYALMTAAGDPPEVDYQVFSKPFNVEKILNFFGVSDEKTQSI